MFDEILKSLKKGSDAENVIPEPSADVMHEELEKVSALLADIRSRTGLLVDVDSRVSGARIEVYSAGNKISFTKNHKDLPIADDSLANPKNSALYPDGAGFDEEAA